MTDQNYVIRQQDRDTAITFIEDQLNENPRWLCKTDSQRIAAEQEYRESRADPASFNAWCQKWLNEAQWAEVKKALCITRSYKKEKLRYVEPHKTISVTHRAWKILSELALHDQLTLSEVIINRLGRK